MLVAAQSERLEVEVQNLVSHGMLGRKSDHLIMMVVSPLGKRVRRGVVLLRSSFFAARGLRD
jgi:hypothetical protein